MRPAVAGRGLRLTRFGPSFDAALVWFGIGAITAIGWVAAIPFSPIDLVSILFVAAAACVVGLARRTAPSLAWIAAIGGMFAAAALPISIARDASPVALGLDGWLRRAVPAGIAALVTLWIAAGYATRRDRRLEPLATPLAATIVGWFVVAFAITIVAAIAGQRGDPAFTWVDVATAPIAWWTDLLLVLVALGVGADLQAAVVRARSRPGGSDRSLGDLVAATLREMSPGTRAAEEARATAERRDLAGDLHASVVPSLRRAIDEAEGNADPSVVLRHLRAADLELERLMTDRWPIVLETFGLVAAIEDLAERLEAGGSPPITIGVEGSDARPPQPVERAAWRFAQVALDNAVRHAAASAIEVRVATSSASARVTVEDDGRGFDPARPAHGRGLADVRRGAAAAGALVSVMPLDAHGTIADFRWPAPAAG